MRNSTLIIAVVIFLLYMTFVFFIPPIIVDVWSDEYGNTGQIGDTMGGIMGPLISVGAAILTFVAFGSQYVANRLQRRDMQKERLENNFFNLLNSLHKLIYDCKIKEEPITNTGLQAFHFIFYEYKAILCKIYLFFNERLPDKQVDLKTMKHISYGIFINGVSKSATSRLERELPELTKEEVNRLNDYFVDKRKSISEGMRYLMDYKDQSGITLFDGHRMYIIPFYNCVCTIVAYIYDSIMNSKYWDIETKYENIFKYCKMMCSQLSEHQLGLLYLMYTYEQDEMHEDKGVQLFFEKIVIQYLVPTMNVKDANFINLK
ncbi:MAG TPA: hypothetical protein IAC03_05140 [Candidatus Coprenecus pullistercoris]|nr:hypothetical protein [Candidatus Coprenecus pullistercoris]